MKQQEVTYYLSADGLGDGKSVCLWRKVGVTSRKIARFQSDAAAKLFAEVFNFPLSDKLAARLARATRSA